MSDETPTIFEPEDERTALSPLETLFYFQPFQVPLTGSVKKAERSVEHPDGTIEIIQEKEMWDDDPYGPHALVRFPSIKVPTDRYIGSSVQVFPVNPSNGQFVALMAISLLTEDSAKARREAVDKAQAQAWISTEDEDV